MGSFLMLLMVLSGVDIETARASSGMIPLDVKSQQSEKYCESVAEITGHAIPNYFEFMLRGGKRDMSIVREMCESNVELIGDNELRETL